MPTYEYKCTVCAFKFEEFQSIADSALEVCPSCKGRLVRLVSGGAGLIFKGSGFYITDYSKNKSKPSSSEEKSDSKPEPKTTDKSEKKGE
jgi:putative FmdB family regulatory protein